MDEEKAQTEQVMFLFSLCFFNVNRMAMCPAADSKKDLKHGLPKTAPNRPNQFTLLQRCHCSF